MDPVKEMEAFEAFLAEHCPGDLALLKALPKHIKDDGPSADRQTVAKFAGAAHTAYQVGKAVYGLGAAVAPYAALLL